MSRLTVAIAEDAVQALFRQVVKTIDIHKTDSTNGGVFGAGYDVRFHLENGDIELNSNGSVEINELDVVWDNLSAWLTIDIPTITLGGWCIIPDLIFGGCAVRLPSFPIFGGSPDITLPLSLPGIRSEVSCIATPVLRYEIDPARPAGENDLAAHTNGRPDHRVLYLDPQPPIDLDLLDLPDMIGDLLDSVLDGIIDGLVGGLPGWAKDLLHLMFGSVVDIVRDVLDIPDDIGEWFTELLGVNLDLFAVVEQAIVEVLAAQAPLHKVEQPMPLDGFSNDGQPVLLDISSLAVSINDDELILTADLA